MRREQKGCVQATHGQRRHRRAARGDCGSVGRWCSCCPLLLASSLPRCPLLTEKEAKRLPWARLGSGYASKGERARRGWKKRCRWPCRQAGPLQFCSSSTGGLAAVPRKAAEDTQAGTKAFPSFLAVEGQLAHLHGSQGKGENGTGGRDAGNLATTTTPPSPGLQHFHLSSTSIGGGQSQTL